MTPGNEEQWTLSVQHDDDDIDRYVEVFAELLRCADQLARGAGATRDRADLGYRQKSLWLDTVIESLSPRAPLRGDTSADVAIVGGGYTGLWTAYALAGLDPTRRIVVVESEVCGFGASGRNGGWASALFAGSAAQTDRLGGPGAADALRAAMVEAVDDIGKTVAGEGIDCDFRKGGSLAVATVAAARRTPPRLARERRPVARAREVDERIRLPSQHGAVFTPHCATIHPANLARGLARRGRAAAA